MAGKMTQREFDSRVKGVPRAARRKPRAPHGRILSGRLLEVALFLFCAAFALELIVDGGRLVALRSAPPTEVPALAAFGAAPMRAARAVVKESGASSPAGLGAQSSIEGFFAHAWDAAIARMRLAFDSASGLRASAEDLIDQLVAAERAIAARLDNLLPADRDPGAGAIGLSSNLPMLAGIGAFAALIALCLGAAVFVSTRVARGTRARRFRFGSRRF
jgi:hypothetical protein